MYPSQRIDAPALEIRPSVVCLMAMTFLLAWSPGVDWVHAQATAEKQSSKDESLGATTETRVKKENPYLRILRNKKDDPIAMQTSIVSFRFRDALRAVLTWWST